MKSFTPTQRLIDLDLILQFDSDIQNYSKSAVLKKHERFSINVERAKLLNQQTYIQEQVLETKILKILAEINNQNWRPEKNIKYG